MRNPALHLAFALTLALAAPLRADTWLGGSSAFWNDDTNWQDSTAPTNGESVLFDNTAVTFDTTLGANFTLHTLQVLDPVLPISLTGGVLTIAGGTIDLSAAAADLTIGSTLVLSNSQTWNVPTGRQLTLAGPFAEGTGPITKTGDGTLVFAGPGIAYTGATIISQGRLVLSNATSFAKGASPASFDIAAGATLEIHNSVTVTIGSTATTLVTGAGTLLKSGPGLLGLDEQGGAQYVIALRLSGGTIDVQGGTLRNGGWTGQQWTDGVTWTNQSALHVAAGAVFDVWDGLDPRVGALTGSGTVTKAAGAGTTRTLFTGTGDRSGTFSGTITNVLVHLALTKVGSGTQTLAGVCAHTGDTTINGGELELAAGGRITASRVLVNAGGLLRLTTGDHIADTLELRVGTNSGAAQVYVGAGLTETVGLFFVQGVIQPAGSHGATGSGAAHTNDALFTGPGLLVAAGGVGVPADGSWGVDNSGEWATPGNWVDGVIAYGTNRTARFTNAITAARSVNNLVAPLDIGNLTFGSPSNNWTITGNDLRLVVDAGIPTVAVQSNTATFAAALTGSQGLAKTGPGRLVLVSNNTFSGTTTLSGGTLQLAGAGSLYQGGTAAGTIDVQGGATLSFDRSDAFGVHSASPLAAVTIRAGGVVENAGAHGNTLRNLTLEGGELRANGGNSATWGAYRLKGTVVATGSAPSRISAPASINQFTQIQLGDNTVNGATTIQVADVTGDVAPDLLVAAALADGRSPADPYPLVASRFVKTGPGTMLLGGNNVNTGPSAVDAGTLVVSGGVVNASIALAAGATLAAQEGPGLVGDYYHLGAALPLTASFNSQYALADHLSTLSPSGLYNFPSNSPNFDFTGGGWPSVMPYTTNYETRWEGTFLAPTSGVYFFSTASDDGSMLWIDGTNVVNNNAFQGTTTKSGTIGLAAGPHTIQIAYYQGTGGYTLQAHVALPGGTTNLLSRNLVTTPPAVGTLTGAAGSTVDVSRALLTVAQVTNGTFSGTLNGTNALRKLGAATLTLDGDNSAFAGGHQLVAGRLSVALDNQLGAPTSPLTFAGGILRITGTTLTDLGAHPVNTGTFNGGIDVADAAHAVNLPNALLTPGYLHKYGPGSMRISNVVVAGVVVHSGLLDLDGGTVSSTVLSAVGRVAGDHGLMALRGTTEFRALVDHRVGDALGATGVVVVSDSARLSGAPFAPLYIGQNGRGVLTLRDNGFISNKVQVGFGTTGVGALYLRGGNLFNSDGPGQDAALGWNAGAYGYLGLFAGAYTNQGWAQVAVNGLGVMQQFGGRFHHQANTGNFDLSRGGTGTLYLAGGIFSSVNGLTVGYNGGTYGLAICTVDDGAEALLGTTVRLTESANQRAILNLNGGVVEATQVSKTAGGTGALAVVNFDGGTLRARQAGNLINVGANAPTAIYVHDGGAVIDTTNFNVTIAPNLLAPPGDGVISIALTNGGANYLGAPVVIVGAGLVSDATAEAFVDLDTNSATFGQVTNLLLTSPGVSYSAAPAVALHGGGGSGAGIGTVTLAPNASGGLTKLGAGTLTLGGTNTYGGPTTVNGGTLLLGSTNAIGTGTLVLAATNLGVGGSFNIDQSFLTWLAGRLTGFAPGFLAIGANTTNSLDLSGAPWTGVVLASGGGAETFSGGLTLAGTNLYLGGTAGTLTYAPVIGSGTNVFIGYSGGSTAGVVVLSGLNSGYGSEINALSGALRAGASNAVGGVTARVIVASGAALDVNGQNLGEAKVFAQGTGPAGGGAIVNTGGQQLNALQYVTLTGPATFSANNRWDLRGTNAVLDLAGFTLTKTGPAQISLVDGRMTDGSVIVSQNIFNIEGLAVVTGGVGTVRVDPAGILQFWNLTGAFDRPVTIDRGVVSAGAGTLSLPSALTLAGATNRLGAGAGATLIPVGPITGTGALVKIYAGTVKLPTNVLYTGPTLVEAGTLMLDSADPDAGTLSASGHLLVQGGGRALVNRDNGLFGTNRFPIKLAGGSLETAAGVYSRIAGPLELAGGNLAGGAPSVTNGCWVLATTVSVTAAGSGISARRTQLAVPDGVVFDVGPGAALTVGGTLEDPGLDPARTGTLIKAGAGTMTMSATNSYRGPTIVAAGTLRLSAPAPLPGSALWLDAADAATVSSTNGLTVNQWSDKSGNARHATQTTLASQPAAATNPLVSGSVLRFSGAQLLNMDLSFLANSEYTIFGVEARTNTGNHYFLGTANGSLNNGLHFGYRDNTTFTLAQYGNDINAGVPGYTAQAFGLWAGALSFSSGHALYRNGTNVASSADITPFTAGIGAGRVGCGFSTQFFQGDLAEILIYNRALSATERQAVEEYLRSKWLLGFAAAGTNVLPTATEVRLAGGATLDLGGVAQAVGSLVDHGGGAGEVLNSSTAPAVLSVGGNGSSASFAGTIRDGTGTVALIKAGAGTVTLSGTNTFSGGLRVLGGELAFTNTLGTGPVFVDTGATLRGSGSAGGVITNAGTVAPAGQLAAAGYAPTPGTLALELRGTAPGAGHDQLALAGPAALAGHLAVTLNGHAPVAGNVYTVLTASAVSGSFATTNLPALGGGLAWQVNYESGAVELEVIGSTSPYDTWTAGYSLSGTNALELADPDGDGYANLLEYSQGSDPTVSNLAARLRGYQTNGLLHLVFNNATSAVDITYLVEAAASVTNGAPWIGILSNVGQTGWNGPAGYVAPATGAVHRVDVEDTASGAQRALRLRITKP